PQTRTSAAWPAPGIPSRARRAPLGHGRGVHAGHARGSHQAGRPCLRGAGDRSVVVRRLDVPGGRGRRVVRYPRALGAGRGAAVITMTAAQAGLMSCHACGLLHRPAASAHDLVCTRCGAALHTRKPDSLKRTWALLIAAFILIIPANLLPVMISGSLFGSETDTIMSGVVFLWIDGSWPLAV